MTSQINFNNINANYPVAGEDNDSQGFRDNFYNIKSALFVAKNEITDLQTNTAKNNTTTNFGGNLIQNAVIQDVNQLIYDKGSVSGTTTLDYTNGHYQSISLNTNTTITITSWPTSSSVMGIMRLGTKLLTTASTNIDFSVTGTGVVLYKDSSLTLPYTTSTTSTLVWELFSLNSGKNIYVKLLGGPFDQV